MIEEVASHSSDYILSKIGEFFEYKESFPSVSSFVQQRQKLHYSAFQALFEQFNSRITGKPVLFKDHRVLAVDGSDISLPFNPKEENVIGDNLVSTLHLNALYDVINKQFLDVIIQRALHEDECGAACAWVDRIPERYQVILLADWG